MPDSHHLWIFLGAATLLAVAPGPGMLYVLARSLAGGRREGLLSSLGTFVGGLVHVAAAATGLSLILATSAIAFAVVKYAGAAYLAYLGIRMILSAREETPIELPSRRKNPFWQGIATEVLNPKTAIFFLAFIPQFVNRASESVFWQFMLLGTISVSLNTLCDIIVTLCASAIGARLRTSAVLRRRQRTATGVTLIGLGAYVAISDAH
jgi:threonine/homoserine/homoserine lactone efflux protein